MDGQCLKKFPVNGSKWKNDVSRFNERFIKNYIENSDIGYFLEVQYQKNFLVLIRIYHFYQKEKNQKNQKHLFVVQKTKIKYVIHIRALKQALNYGLILKEAHRVIQFD